MASAKDNMFEPDLLKKHLAKAKRDTFKFAFFPGSGKADPVFGLTKKQEVAPDKIYRDAKKRTSAPKGTCGTLDVEDKKILFTLERDLPGVVKSLKLLLKKNDLGTFKVRIVDASGNELDDEEGGENETSTERRSGVQIGGHRGEPAPARSGERPRVQLGGHRAARGQPSEAAPAEPAPAQVEATTTDPSARDFSECEQIWQMVQDRTSTSAESLAKALDEIGHDITKDLASQVRQLVGEMPAQPLGDVLSELTKTSDEKAIAQHKKAATTGIKNCLVYIKTNEEKFKACEDNPLGVSVRIKDPLLKSLQTISANLR